MTSVRVTILGSALSIDASYLDAPPAAVRRQVAAYERGDRRVFDLGVSYPESFLGRVMVAMAAIPYGETRTYGALADDLDTAAVAVGQACGANPVPLVVPCHRVVGVDGLRGYSGEGGVALKRALLAHEGAAVPGGDGVDGDGVDGGGVDGGGTGGDGIDGDGIDGDGTDGDGTDGDEIDGDGVNGGEGTDGDQLRLDGWTTPGGDS